MTVITQRHIDNALSYQVYRTLIDRLISEGKTTGNNHSEQMLSFTELNIHRMSRIDRKFSLTERTITALTSVKTDQIWIVLCEAWCGDGAQNLPMLAKMADISERIQLGILLRDDNLDVMDQFLTHGGRSIPKVICLDASTLETLWVWGPRPEPAQQLAIRFKSDPGQSREAFQKDLQLWYARDKGLTIQKEICQLLNPI